MAGACTSVVGPARGPQWSLAGAAAAVAPREGSPCEDGTGFGRADG